MTLLIAVAGLFLFWRMSQRMGSLEARLEGLTLRLHDLEKASSRAPVVARPTPAPTAVVTPPPVVVQPRTPPTPVSVPVTAPVVAPRPEPVRERKLELFPGSLPAAATAAAAMPTTAKELPLTLPPAESLETRIGSRWLLYVGVLAIVIGAAYFEKLAIDNHWLSETMRVAQGTLVGLLMAVGAHYLIRRGYDTYGQILSGCGMAVMYVAAYAAFNFYHLVSYGPAFVWMAGLTALTAALGDRYRSQGLAIVAIGGGFATPFLLPSSSVSEIPLFTYDALLIAGTMFLIHRRGWPMLGIVTYIATLLTLDVWLVDAYRPSRYLTTELFLTLFTVMFLGTLWLIRRSADPLAGFARLILWTVVPFYYFASLMILAPHDNALLIYLLALSAIGVSLSRNIAPRLRPLFWGAAIIPLMLWTATHQEQVWLAAGLSAWTGIFVLHLSGVLDAIRPHERKAGWPELFVLHANGLVSFGGAYLLLDAVHPGLSAPVAAGLAALHAGIAVSLTRFRRDVALHFAAAAFSLLSLAIAAQFDGAWAITGWAAEAAGITWLGLREQRVWMRVAGLALLAFSVARLLELLFSQPTVGQLVMLNPRAVAGLFVVGLLYALAWAHHQQADERQRAHETGIALVVATLMVLVVAVSEIVAFWALRGAAPFEPTAHIVIASLLAGSGVVWMGAVRRQEWMRSIGLGVIGLAVLTLLSIQLTPAPADYRAVQNGRALAGAVAVAACYAVMQLYRRRADEVPSAAVYVAALSTAASLLTLSLISSEIETFWSAGAVHTVWRATRQALHAVAWTAIGTLLVWRGLISRHLAVRVVGGLLLTIGIALLADTYLVSSPAGYLPIVNARFVASALVIGLLCVLARRLGQDTLEAESFRLPRIGLWVIANGLAVATLSADIFGYWDAREALSMAPNGSLAREMMLTLSWALYATGAIVVGLRRDYAPIRYFAIALFGIAIVKVFAVDLSYLSQIYRVLSILGLGVLLLITSYLYQRARKSRT